MIGGAPLHISLLLTSAALTSALGLYAFRERQEPGATAFVVLMVVLASWSMSYAIGLLTPPGPWRVFWMRMVWFSTGTIEVWLLLFALAYTGYDEFVTRRTVAGLLVVPAIVIAGIWTNSLHHLFWIDHSFLIVDGLVIENPTWGILFWAEVVYTYLLVAVASALLIRLIYQSDFLYTDQSALLLVGIVVPFITSVLDVFVLNDFAAIDPTPYAFTITGVAFAYALFHHQLFDLVPATRQLGRNAAISQLDAGVVIVDNANRIIYCNTATEEVLDCEAADAVGSDIELLVGQSQLDFGTEDALAEIERGDQVYEIRASPITDRRDRQIGNTLVIHDVTARQRRERQLAKQRDELETANRLNAVLRGVNQALVSARSREEIEQSVPDRLADSDLYRVACLADIPTWNGDANRWTIADGGQTETPSPPALDGVLRPLEGEPDDGTTPLVADGDDSGTWTVVPVLFGRTVYGALGLYTDREAVSDRERSILRELGETIGHAFNAVETRQLLSAESIVELELECTDETDPLVAVTEELTCEIELQGVVPAREGTAVAYVTATGTDASSVREAFPAASEVDLVREEDGETLLEWRVGGDSLLGTLVDFGANVTEIRADSGRARYELSIASDSTARSLMDQIGRRYEHVHTLSKVERTREFEEGSSLSSEHLDQLTDRQRESIEAAYRAGYFNWPRDSTAEDIAETLDISSATLHSHLRKAEQSLLAELFDTGENS
ncbi:histidine kinase N-terminal 7TM domain-containing protein [Halostella salina]|uniref:histidine kinase N-terminal 7TM domain-containing protein n=1 Tax=Halostella salina TaxID=1547897 RepID=UPI0013CF2495|nr:histidine kinase N-terminal 7TM domain-containing protein [Halostella salina]